MKRILFICTGNSCRSQMAEVLANYYGRFKVQAFSAGVSPMPVTQTTKTVLEEIGLDTSSLQSKHLDHFSKDQFDFVITLSDHAKSTCMQKNLAKTNLHWDIEDPYSESVVDKKAALSKYKRVRDQLKDSISDFLENL